MLAPTLILVALWQAPVPGLVRGELLEAELTGSGGELSVRTAANRVLRFAFDQRTYFERDKRRIAAAELVKGEAVEVVSDEAPGLALRYARTVHVLEPPEPPRRPSAGRVRSYRSPLEHIVPRGNLTFAGLVLRIGDDALVLRTRGGDKTVMLRQDTRYLEDGLQVQASQLTPNMRVFIRAGKNLDDEIEAYQVVWGGILQPR